MRVTAAAHSAHTVLDTDFADGTQFFALWRQWRDAPKPRAMLHYVGLQTAPLSGQPVQADEAQSREWAQATAGVLGRSGFCRLLFEGGRISFTLCLGDPRASLTRLVLQADHVILGAACAQGQALAALPRCCKRGTKLTCSTALTTAGGPDAASLQALGFQPEAATEWVFDPAWTVRRSRQTPRRIWPQPRRCTVIGAGISGASVARALALRGWQVQVLDAHEHPGLGASGLPAGLVSPVYSADDGPVSQLTRIGCALMRQHAQKLLVQGQDWAPSGAWLHQVADDPTLQTGVARHLPEARAVVGAVDVDLRRGDEEGACAKDGFESSRRRSLIGQIAAVSENLGSRACVEREQRAIGRVRHDAFVDGDNGGAKRKWKPRRPAKLARCTVIAEEAQAFGDTHEHDAG